MRRNGDLYGYGKGNGGGVKEVHKRPWIWSTYAVVHIYGNVTMKPLTKTWFMSIKTW